MIVNIDFIETGRFKLPGKFDAQKIAKISSKKRLVAMVI